MTVRLGWTLDQALGIIPLVEPVAAKHGLHIGICGSVLHKRQSKDDLDLVVFPLKTDLTHDFAGFQNELIDLGFAGWINCGKYHEDDSKRVFSCFYQLNQRVDWFLFHIDSADVDTLI